MLENFEPANVVPDHHWNDRVVPERLDRKHRETRGSPTSLAVLRLHRLPVSLREINREKQAGRDSDISETLDLEPTFRMLCDCSDGCAA
jgi:hypothetical protein